MLIESTASDRQATQLCLEHILANRRGLDHLLRLASDVANGRRDLEVRLLVLHKDVLIIVVYHLLAYLKLYVVRQVARKHC